MIDIEISEISQRLNWREKVRALYYNSFPPEERRPWTDVEQKIAARDKQYNVYVIEIDCEFAGFISWWQLKNVRYIEHFAIEECQRGHGIGYMAISKFMQMSQHPIVLEVELPERGDVEQRRVRFYERCGFVAQKEVEYKQPSYGEGLPEIPLMLMVYLPEFVNIKETIRQIYQDVYKKR